jgi:hypothetical protein
MVIFNSYVKLPEGKTNAINHPSLGIVYAIYKKCDDWGMVYDIALTRV